MANVLLLREDVIEGLGLVCALNLRESFGTPSGEFANPTEVRLEPELFGVPLGDAIDALLSRLKQFELKNIPSVTKEGRFRCKTK